MRNHDAPRPTRTSVNDTYCNQYKSNNHIARTPVQAYNATATPFDSINTNLTGQKLSRTQNGNNNIMIVKYALARWVELIAIPNKEEITIVRVLFERTVCKYGVHGQVMSD